MRLRVDLDLPGLEDALADLLPSGFSLRGLEMDGQQLVLAIGAPMVGAVELLAQVQVRSGQLTLDNFDLRGAGFAKGVALSAVRRKLAGLDRRHGEIRLWGESDGERAHLSWGQ